MILLFLAACGSESDLPWQAEAAIEARELELLMPVEIVEMTREEFAAQAADEVAELDPERLAYLRDFYGRMGFFDPELDLEPILAGSSSDWVGATYWEGRITLVGDYADSSFVHEFVHALQDQHFGIVAYDLYDTSDGFLARRGIVEGDATLAEYRFEVDQDRGADLDDISWPPLLEAWQEWSVDVIVDGGYPPIFLDYVSFTYPYGLAFSAHNLLDVDLNDPIALPSPHDWGRQDALFTQPDPPSTTQAVMMLGDPDPVVAVGIDDVPPGLERWEAVDWDRMGEWYTWLLFFDMHLAGALDAAHLASAWDGDTALLLRDEAEVGAVVWATAWDDEVFAQQFADALADLHGLAEGLAADGEPMTLERRGSVVVFVKNMPAEEAAVAADAAFASPLVRRARTHPSLPAIQERIRLGLQPLP